VTTPTRPPRLPSALTTSARLRREGRLAEATEVLHAALADFQANPLDGPFQDRVLVGLGLADMYLLADEKDRAGALLRTEQEFAEQILELIRQSGMPDQVRSATMGYHQLRERATQVDLLGNAAPEIEIADWVLGAPTTLADQRGRVVLIEFWARWCRSCLDMFPVLRHLHERYARHGLTVLALTSYLPGPGTDPITDLASERDLIRQTIIDQAIEFAVGIAPDSRLQGRYGAAGIPSFAVVDRAGVVQLASSKPDKANLEKVIADLLNVPNGYAN
jgi:thiol-disulfide isomerase/thioredoxin